MRYESAIYEEEIANLNIIKKQCADMGDIGYRLVSTIPHGGRVILFFEKEVQE
jgi:hypothetical protein